jgi:hypothetical protein
MYHHVNSLNGQESPLVNKEFYEFVCANAEKLDSAIIYDRDFDYDYFGFKVSYVVLLRPYLCRTFYSGSLHMKYFGP